MKKKVKKFFRRLGEFFRILQRDIVLLKADDALHVSFVLSLAFIVGLSVLGWIENLVIFAINGRGAMIPYHLFPYYGALVVLTAMLISGILKIIEFLFVKIKAAWIKSKPRIYD